MSRGSRDMSGFRGLLVAEATVSDHRGQCKPLVKAADVAPPPAVYTDVQMLEMHLKNCHFRPGSSRSESG